MVQNFAILQSNDVIARPKGWTSLFLGSSVRKKHASVLRWQMRNPEITNLVRQKIDLVLGRKFLDQWLLISEKKLWIYGPRWYCRCYLGILSCWGKKTFLASETINGWWLCLVWVWCGLIAIVCFLSPGLGLIYIQDRSCKWNHIYFK